MSHVLLVGIVGFSIALMLVRRAASQTWGSNLSITGSPATILCCLALRKEKLAMSFEQFLTVALRAMQVALVA